MKITLRVLLAFPTCLHLKPEPNLLITKLFVHLPVNLLFSCSFLALQPTFSSVPSLRFKAVLW